MLYVDPGAGSILLQVASAAVLGGLLVTKRWWTVVSDSIRAGRNRLWRR